MKKGFVKPSFKGCILLKILIMIKLTWILTIVFALQLAANTENLYSQITKIDLVTYNMSLEDLIWEIQKQTEFDFFYSTDDIVTVNDISISLKNVTVDEILEEALRKTNLTFNIVNKAVIIKKEKKRRLFELKELPKIALQQPEIIVRGKVTDKDGVGLPGVNVVEKGTANGAITNLNGEYTIAIASASSSVLIFSFIGFLTEEIEVAGQSLINITLIEDIQELDEIVVIGYGSIKKSDLTGSVASVSSDDFQNSSSKSVIEVLQGRAAGVQVSTGDGSPGGGFNIRIRGTSTINSTTEPLYIVDGFPINSNSEDLYVAGGIAENIVEDLQANKVRPNALSMINPNDIESIEILKDASATAIYGARGANGVVLIKTKRGESGDTKVNFNYSFGIQELSKKIPRLTGPEYAEWINEGYRNSGYTYDYYDGSDYWRPLPQDAITTDWQDLIYRTAPSKNYSLSLSGGNEKTKYLISGDYLNQQGIIIKSGYERASARVNIDQQVRKFLKVGANINVLHSSNDRIAAGSGVISTNVVRNVLETAPTEDPEWFDEATGKWFLNPDEPNNHTNPLKIIEDTDDEVITNRIIGNTFVDLDIFKNLKFHGTVGIDYSDGERQTFLKSTLKTSQEDVIGGHATNAMTTVNRWMANGYFSWDKAFNNHNISATTGMETQTQTKDTRLMDAQNFDSEDIGMWGISTGSVGVEVDATRIRWQSVGYFSRLSYNFKNKYYVTANYRIDGSSRFGAENKWGFFPSIAGAWRASEEAFIKDLDLFSNLKVRVSYGETGNGEIAPYSSLGTWYLASKNYSFDGQAVSSAFLSRMANPDLKWETTKQYNIGLDAGFFNHRLGLTFDYYIKNTEDLIIGVTVPQTTGFTSALKNVGALRNEGAEFTITAVPLQGEFSWDVNYNMSFMRGTVTDLGGDSYIVTAGWARLGGLRLEVDKPACLIMGSVYDGIYNSQEEIDAGPEVSDDYKPGYYKPKDIDGDNKITTNDVAPLGNGQPDFIFGLTNNFSYKNFDLHVFVQGSYGNEIAMMYNRDMYEIRDNSWTEENHDAKYAINAIDGHGQARISNMNVYDGSYIRLKDIRLGYNFSLKSIKWMSVAKIYFNASNLVTITDYPGYNPDISSGGSYAFGEGFDMGIYPLAKIYKIGINLTF